MTEREYFENWDFEDEAHGYWTWPEYVEKTDENKI
jgi:hypothetical protein